jgi:hypothetical protein
MLTHVSTAHSSSNEQAGPDFENAQCQFCDKMFFNATDSQNNRGHHYQFYFILFYFDIISYQYQGPKSDILSCKYHFQIKSDMR